MLHGLWVGRRWLAEERALASRWKALSERVLLRRAIQNQALVEQWYRGERVGLNTDSEEEESSEEDWAVEFGAGVEGIRRIDPAAISEDEGESSQAGTPTGSVASGDLQQWSEDEATEAANSSGTGSSVEDLEHVEVVTVPARGGAERLIYDRRRANRFYADRGGLL